MSSVHEEAATRRTLSLTEAKDMAAAYFGFAPSIGIEEAGEVFEVPAQVFWDREQTVRMTELREYVDTLDKRTVERRDKVTGAVLLHPKTGEVDSYETTVYELNGVPIRPTYDERYLDALFGEEKAGRAQRAGITYQLVKLLEMQMDNDFEAWKARRSGDSKSR